MIGRPIPPLVLSEEEVQHSQYLASSRTLSHSILQRAKLVLACRADANTGGQSVPGVNYIGGR